MNRQGMRAALAVAGVYGFFLIFAQFSFVELLRGAGVGLLGEKWILGIMAVAGIGGGFFAAWRELPPRLARMGLLGAAIVSGLAPFATQPWGFGAIACLTGLALGIVTVSLAAMLPAWCGVMWVGVGTGLGYALCNLPAVFLQSPTMQSWIGSGFALVGALAMRNEAKWSVDLKPVKVFPIGAALALFTALVWMDSAAFFIIQHAGDLRSGTWGDALLWRNAAVHFLVAVGAGLWMAKGQARTLPAAGWVALAVAALAVNHAATRGIAAWFYPAGVSLYSAALVAWPGWFSGATNSRAAGWRAAWLFGVAGWFGSANGIGMAQTLQQVPPAFVAAAGGVVGAVMLISDRRHWRAAVAVGCVLLAGWQSGISQSRYVIPVSSSAAERGRKVYVSEGCIHCHSQYVRPQSQDPSFWGPPREAGKVLAEEPVLIGNRRQGPDLANIGARRSETWLKLHFIDPRSLIPGSPMPSYAHLFESGRGDDLVRYLKELGVEHTAELMQRCATWKPASTAKRSENGAALFSSHCASCHGEQGRGDGPLAGQLSRPPTNLVNGPFVRSSEPVELARLIKFGIVGTDMAGHETLPDEDVNALVDEVLKLRNR